MHILEVRTFTMRTFAYSCVPHSLSEASGSSRPVMPALSLSLSCGPRIERKIQQREEYTSMCVCECVFLGEYILSIFAQLGDYFVRVLRLVRGHLRWADCLLLLGALIRTLPPQEGARPIVIP